MGIRLSSGSRRRRSPKGLPLHLEAVYGATRLRAMELLAILKRCYRFRGFVYQHAHFSADKKSIEVAVRRRKGSAAVCSRCHLAEPGYDQLAFAPTESSNLHSVTHLASCQSRNPPTISSDELKIKDRGVGDQEPIPRSKFQ
jgi:hypothetical protein